MKKIAFLFLVLVSVQSLNAQIPSNCDVLPVLQSFYDRDVKHLALTRIYDQQSSAMDSINIPQSYQDTVWQAMAAVFNLTDIPARDTVFDFYCIHQYSSNYIFYNIYVSIEPTCTWLQQWQNLIITTGVPALDTLLSTYGFTITHYWTSLNVATLTTNQTINVRPVCDSIATFNGVVYSEPQPTIGLGDEINYTKTGINRFLDFVIGYGDCMSGCTGFLTLKFQIYEDCSVQYFGSILIPASGYSFPPPVNCNITMNVESGKNNNGFRVFPNPVDNILNIQIDQVAIINFSVINSLGQTMKTGQILKEAVISMENLAAGIYSLRLYETQSQKSVATKFIKNH